GFVMRPGITRYLFAPGAEPLLQKLLEVAPANTVSVQSFLSKADGTHSTRWVEERLDFSDLEPVLSQVGRREPAEPGGPEEVDVEVEGRRYKVRVWAPEGSRATAGGGAGAAAPARARRSKSGAPVSGSAAASGPARLVAPMQGTIVEVLVAVGDAVEAGQSVCVMEAMKMENRIDADRAGTVTEVRVTVGANVGAGDVLLVME
ncbi:MAG: biotin/lipoyl-containing protein, partial [Acidimicrobiales bacterium]